MALFQKWNDLVFRFYLAVILFLLAVVSSYADISVFPNSTATDVVWGASRITVADYTLETPEIDVSNAVFVAVQVVEVSPEIRVKGDMSDLRLEVLGTIQGDSAYFTDVEAVVDRTAVSGLTNAIRKTGISMIYLDYLCLKKLKFRLRFSPQSPANNEYKIFVRVRQ